MRFSSSVYVSLYSIFSCILFSSTALWGQEELFPASWQENWTNPPAIDRPLQIVHGEDMTDSGRAVYYRDECGLGGLVVNVGGKDYIRSQENWDRFVRGVRQIRNAGLRVWIYDEQGYPSLTAGGVVLEGHPELVSKELVWDPNAESPFTVRDCYEFTHSCNNYSAARRYPNPLEPEAVARFIEVTHARYQRELGNELYGQVEAFFTDEPSLMAANLGPLPDDVRKNVPVDDPLDPNKKNLPMIPWCSDMEACYQRQYGTELAPHLQSLFEGDSEQDATVRGQFWALVAQLYSERYFGAIKDFCRRAQGPVSSGHTLHEGILRGHVPLDGNKLQTLRTLDRPGLDLLTSDPEAGLGACWLDACFPCSAALQNGERRVMTEVSDFSQAMGNPPRWATLAEMQATAAWQAAWGVTDFALYYSIRTPDGNRTESTHRAYCEFVGRLNALLLPAQPVRSVILYYPITLFQREFRPVAHRVSDTAPSPAFEKAASSFVELGTALVQAQIPFTVMDDAALTRNGLLESGSFRAILFPRGTAPSEELAKRLADVGLAGSPNLIQACDETPLNGPNEMAEATKNVTGPRLQMTPATSALSQGVFTREGRTIFVVTNLGRENYCGHATLVGVNQPDSPGPWLVLDPQSGQSAEWSPETDIQLNSCETKVYIAPRQ